MGEHPKRRNHDPYRPSFPAFTALHGSTCCSRQAPKKPIVYIPFAQSEFAYNLIKECPAIEVTWILEGSDFAVSWGVNERENRNDWVVYTSKDGHVTGSGETMRVSAAARDICKMIATK